MRTAQSARESAQILGQGFKLFVGGLLAALDGGQQQITAGTGAPTSFDGNVFVARFEPGERVIHKGETVHWTRPRRTR